MIWSIKICIQIYFNVLAVTENESIERSNQEPVKCVPTVHTSAPSHYLLPCRSITNPTFEYIKISKAHKFHESNQKFSWETAVQNGEVSAGQQRSLWWTGLDWSVKGGNCNRGEVKKERALDISCEKRPACSLLCPKYWQGPHITHTYTVYTASAYNVRLFFCFLSREKLPRRAAGQQMTNHPFKPRHKCLSAVWLSRLRRQSELDRRQL